METEKKQVTQWTSDAPTLPGIYWLAKSANEWDVAMLVGVRKVTTATRSWTEVEYFDNNVPCNSSRHEQCIWYGPIERPLPPSEEFIKWAPSDEPAPKVQKHEPMGASGVNLDKH